METRRRGRPKGGYQSPTKQKILLLLMAGYILTFNRSPRTHWYILTTIPKAWKSINRRALRDAVREFYEDRLVDFHDLPDGSSQITLTQKGREKVIRIRFNDMKIRSPLRWDHTWKVVLFDIPEKRRAARDALRQKLRALGFHELHKSVWVHPYECENEINALAELFEIRPFVRYGRIKGLTNEDELRLHFDL